MKTNLLTVTNARFLSAIEYQKSVVGYVMMLLDVDNNTYQEVLGMFDIYRAPISDILVSKGGFKLTIENNMPTIVDSTGNHFNYEFFDAMEKSTGKKYTTSVSQLPQDVQKYLSEQISLFNQHILQKDGNSQPQVQAQPVPQQVQAQPVPQQVQAQPVTPVAKPVTPVPQQAPVQPVAQPVQPVAQPVAQPVTHGIRREPGELISTDDFPVGTFMVRSVIDPSQRLPEFMGLNENGVKVYGPDKYTEEECIAVIQLKSLVYSAGEHLLTEKEKQMLDEMNEGKDSAKDNVNNGIDLQQLGTIDALNKMRAQILQRITSARKAERNVLQIKESVQKSLSEGVPFELMGTKYSLYYMSVVGDDGKPPEGKGHPQLLERARQLQTQGKIVSTPVSNQVAKPQVTHSAPIAMPTAGISSPTMPQASRPVATGNAPTQMEANNLPFTRPVAVNTPVNKPSKSATAIIRKLLTSDGQTIEGIVFDINGTLQGQQLNKRCVNSLEAIARAYSALMRQVEFTNAELVLTNGKVEVVMTPEHLNLIDILPEKRFMYADELQGSTPPITVLLNKDAKLHELIEISKARHTKAPQTEAPSQPVVQTTPVQTPVQQVAQPVPQTVQPVAQSVAQPVQPKAMPESVKQFVDLLKETTLPILPITDVGSGIPKVVMLNVAEMKQYLGL